MARTDNLTNFLTDVATAIKAKKGDETPIPASDFDTEITNLPSGGGGSVTKIAPYSISFSTIPASEFDLSSVDPSNIYSMDSMFRACANLKSINLDNFVTSTTKNTKYMFQSCGSLETITLSGDFSNISDVSGMFDGCKKLTSLNLNVTNVNKISSLSEMFRNCSSLTSIDLSSFNIAPMWTSSMFVNCSKLELIDISGIDFTNVNSYNYTFGNVPSGCLIYVKDEAAKAWIEEKFTNLTNVQVKGSV